MFESLISYTLIHVGMVSDTLIFSSLVEHFTPLLEQIIKLEEALFNIQYEQHWLEAQTERQAIGKSLTRLLSEISMMLIRIYI